MLKKKLKKYNPIIKEECGVFGISNSEDASTLTALGLHALQHRGQESCGIVSFDGKKYHLEKISETIHYIWIHYIFLGFCKKRLFEAG